MVLINELMIPCMTSIIKFKVTANQNIHKIRHPRYR